MVTFDKRRFDNLKGTVTRAVEIGRKAKDVFAAREGLYAEMLQYAPVDPQEVFALTFGIFAASRGDTEQAMLGGANIGRDADTIASLNGQLSGALNGVDSIPEAWLEGFESLKGASKFIDTARGMTELVKKRLKSMTRHVNELSQMTGGT
jgi:ADP-ribosylglycohydrolase